MSAEVDEVVPVATHLDWKESCEHGVEKAVILSLIRSVNLPRTKEGGVYWVRIGLQEWAEIAPWWSLGTIRRHLGILRDDGVVDAKPFEKWDRTLWYSICGE